MEYTYIILADSFISAKWIALTARNTFLIFEREKKYPEAKFDEL